MIGAYPISDFAISGHPAPATVLQRACWRRRRFVAMVTPADLAAANDAVATISGHFCNPYRPFFRIALIATGDPDEHEPRWWLAYAEVDPSRQCALRDILIGPNEETPIIASLEYRQIPVGLPARQTVMAWLTNLGLRLRP